MKLRNQLNDKAFIDSLNKLLNDDNNAKMCYYYSIN